MASSENEASSPVASVPACMNKFRLYETLSNFYMIGRDKNRTCWRVLKIDRQDPAELNVCEDSTTYTENECSDLLRRIHEGNKSTGGLKFVTTCYGIVGFVKFLGPYYMLLITKRRQIGAICGHAVYAVSKSEMIPLRNSSANSNITDAKNENRYKKLLCMVDLTKDFFFSYSYHIMRSLQRNLCENETGHVLYETMFVWNEFLTQGIRNHLQNTVWTVALVYGFFKQDTLTISGREFILTLISRRSRHYAGTRYLRRGVNEKGRVANDVETEQIVFEDVPEGLPVQISSVVQNRGSIPLFWSQETSRLNLKPDIICISSDFLNIVLLLTCSMFLLYFLHQCSQHMYAYVVICSSPVSKKDQNYQATRLHFENLVKRYGNPIIILNLIKTRERKPRESILRTEFGNAIDFINKDLPEENRLRFLHWDLHKHFQSKSANVLLLLGKVAAHALTLTGFFYCQVTPTFRPEDCIKWPSTDFACGNADEGSFQPTRHVGVDEEDANNIGRKPSGENNVINGNHSLKQPMFQRGVLRTNCIDCIDRTNVAQYAYGLAALGHQLHALGIIDHPKIDLDDPLGDDLMRFYEQMGDILAHQYGGSAAHNKIFSERRGQWRAATQSQEFFRTLRRYYSNAYMDAEKQNAINVFLGHFQPQQGKPAPWELGSDQHYDVEKHGDDDARSIVKICFSDGSILHDSSTALSAQNPKLEKFSKLGLVDQSKEGSEVFCESSPEISTSESDMSFSRSTPSVPRRHLFGDIQREHCLETDHILYSGHKGLSSSSNFVDLDCLSFSGNSCEEEPFERSSITNSTVAGFSSENVVNGVIIGGDTTPSTSDLDSSSKGSHSGRSKVLEEFPDTFVHWVTNGQTLH
ncbi:phosphoinositide phosphatase SAC3-like isoform X2 [Lotus japonicus]|uniref:phosphoinositide phosphatase SAC3-like isoform X2 n=1 Tax=Lotus japonicus TaxID=34305 RepID=UPI00258B40FB|nr:phosphoinositide phosphatase SAC3-like isoform X2 [Lotus japonicus]